MLTKALGDGAGEGEHPGQRHRAGDHPHEVQRGALVVARAHEKALATIPQGRIGDPEDITGAVLYFAGQASGFTTGSVLVIDGGQTLGLAY